MKRLLTLLAASSFSLLVACPDPKMPTGPAPEYEDPPAPSWAKDGGGAPAVPEPGFPPGILDAPPPSAPPSPADAGPSS